MRRLPPGAVGVIDEEEEQEKGIRVAGPESEEIARLRNEGLVATGTTLLWRLQRDVESLLRERETER